MAWGNLFKHNKNGNHFHPHISFNASSLLKPQTRRPFATGSLPTPVAPFSHNIYDGAPESVQKEWDNMSVPQRMLARTKYEDTDGDRVPDPYDCEPFNPMRQHKKNRMFREQVENKMNFAGLFRMDTSFRQEEGQRYIDQTNAEVKAESKRDMPKARAYPLYRKGSYKFVNKQDIVNAVAKNPQLLPLMKEVHFDNLDADESMNYGVMGRYHAKDNWNSAPGNKIDLGFVVPRKTDVGMVIRHELAHHTQNKDDVLMALSNADAAVRKSPYGVRHKDLPGEQDAERRMKEDERLKKPDNTPRPWGLKKLFPEEQEIKFPGTGFAEYQKEKEEREAREEREDHDDVVSDYWDDDWYKKGGYFVKRLAPKAFLDRTLTAPIDSNAARERMGTYADEETNEMEPIGKLQGHIESPTTAVEIPFVQRDGKHEGRHRMWAAMRAGQETVPTATTAPASWTNDNVFNEWFNRLYKDNPNKEWVADKKSDWKAKFQEDFPTETMDRKQTQTYIQVLKDKGVYDEAKYITDEEKKRDRADDTTMDYWDVPKVKRQGMYVKWMRPAE